jgi:putative ABC transport system ATP-binding protein
MSVNSISAAQASQTAPQPEPLIRLRDVKFRWKSPAPWLLDIPQLDIMRGEKVFLLGSSGSGKSTLLNLLAGIARPTSGQVDLLGASFSDLSQRKRDLFRAQHIGIIFQQFNLIPYLSVLDNIVLGAHFAGQRGQSVQHNAQNLCERLGLSEALLAQPARQTSVGQQQRIAVARALLLKPEILIADEPTSALDSDSRDAFMSVLLETAEQSGSTVLFVSHDKNLQPFFNRHLDIRLFKADDQTATQESRTCC